MMEEHRILFHQLEGQSLQQDARFKIYPDHREFMSPRELKLRRLGVSGICDVPFAIHKGSTAQGKGARWGG
jgi:hypothetical protein